MQTDNKEIKIREWKETIASECRWSEFAAELVGDWIILWEDSCSDYQGHASVLAYKRGQIRYLSWEYGSCSGCDVYEGMSIPEIRKEFESNIMMHFKDIDSFCVWMKMLFDTNDEKFTQFYNAISAAFKDPKIDWLGDPGKLQDKINVLSLLKE